MVNCPKLKARIVDAKIKATSFAAFPNIKAGIDQADWNLSDATKATFIKNKPVVASNILLEGLATTTIVREVQTLILLTIDLNNTQIANSLRDFLNDLNLRATNEALLLLADDLSTDLESLLTNVNSKVSTQIYQQDLAAINKTLLGKALSSVVTLLAKNAATKLLLNASAEAAQLEINSIKLGMNISASQLSAIELVHNTIIKHNIIADLTITFNNGALNKSTTMELWLIMPETVVPFSMPNVSWLEEPSFDTANTLYAVVLRWDGEKIIANIAYTLEVS